jgi:hypothetical protein
MKFKGLKHPKEIILALRIGHLETGIPSLDKRGARGELLNKRSSNKKHLSTFG